jgi:REP element-mobilizing transposase RayT
MITNRPRRLAGVSYVGFQRYFVTTCTAFKRPIFEALAIGNDTASQILRAAREREFAVTAYCLMPNHVHLLLVAQSVGADLPRFVKHAKQVTGFAYRKAKDRSLWQPGYHERVLRDDEATLAVARYIVENPVRAGLAKALGEWPLSGSDVYTWPELLTAWERQT